MKRIDIEIPVGYTIRFAGRDDIPAIMSFFKKHWKETHILANDREFFEYEFCREDEVCFVLLLNQNGEIEGTLGYIPYGGESRDIFTVMWKALDNGQIFAGVGMLYYLVDYGRCRHIFTSGLNENTRSIYRYLGYQTGNLSHFYMLNANVNNRIACMEDKTELNLHEPESSVSLALARIADKEEFLAYYRPEERQDKIAKSAEYMVRRYFEHPKYEYFIYQLVREGEKTNSFLIAREQKHDGNSILRLIDFVGDENLLQYSGGALRQLMNEKEYEYIDFYEFGIDDDILYHAGFTKKADNSLNVIPNYFSPFCSKNINIGIFWEKEMHPIICKGDGDQDRPSSQ